MKLKKILWFLLGLFIYINFHIDEYHDLALENGQQDTIIELFNQNIFRQKNEIQYLLRWQTHGEQYSIVSHIVIDDPAKVKSISADLGGEVLFDLSSDEIKNLSDGVIEDAMTRTITLKYSNEVYHEDGYYTLYFNRLNIDPDDTLTINVTRIDENGSEQPDIVYIKVVKRYDWGIFLWDAMSGV